MRVGVGMEEGRADRWNEPATAAAYEAFCATSERYDRSNAELVRHAELGDGMRVLDLGAGTGRTAAACLPALGSCGAICCVEPARAMRTVGEGKLRDPRVSWREGLPGGEGSFDRVVCGAALWQIRPLDEVLGSVARLLRPGGAFAFTMPALYLGEVDEPGGGPDPWFLELIARLAAGGDPGTASPEANPAGLAPPPLTSEGLDGMLRDAGLAPSRWAFRYRMSEREYATWLTLPPVNEGILRGVPIPARAGRVEAALRNLAGARRRESWRWEGWRGWTARKG